VLLGPPLCRPALARARDRLRCRAVVLRAGSDGNDRQARSRAPQSSPCTNNDKCIGCLLREVRRLVDVDALVVDDSSPDGTVEAVAAVRAADPAIRLLVRPPRLGLASADLASFAHAVQYGHDLVFEMEGNLSRSPRYLPLFLKQIGEPDLVVGSRCAPGGRITLTRVWTLRFASTSAAWHPPADEARPVRR
jgi:glycosyltransferase involved in cell wall biosynthesis